MHRKTWAAHARRRPVPDWPDVQVDGLQAAEGGRHAGANAVKTVEAGLRLDPLDAPAKVKCRSPMSRSKCLAIFLLSTTAPTDRHVCGGTASTTRSVARTFRVEFYLTGATSARPTAKPRDHRIAWYSHNHQLQNHAAARDIPTGIYGCPSWESATRRGSVDT